MEKILDHLWNFIWSRSHIGFNCGSFGGIEDFCRGEQCGTDDTKSYL